MCVVMSWKNLLLEVLEGDGKMPDDNNGGYMDLNNIEGAEVEDIEDENLQFELPPPETKTQFAFPAVPHSYKIATL